MYLPKMLPMIAPWFLCLDMSAGPRFQQTVVEPEPRSENTSTGNDEASKKGAVLRDKLREIYGGLDKLRSLADIKIEMTTQSLRRRRFTKDRVEYYSVKTPRWQNKSFLSNRTNHMGFDGKRFWEVDPPGRMGIGDLYTASQSERYWMWNLPVLLTRDMFSFLFLREESFSDRMCSVVRVPHPKDGTRLVDLWVDKERGWILKAVHWREKRDENGNQRYAERVFEDYRPVDGIPFPFLIRAVGKVPFEVRVQSITLNPDLPEGFYSKPKAGESSGKKEEGHK